MIPTQLRMNGTSHDTDEADTRPITTRIKGMAKRFAKAGVIASNGHAPHRRRRQSPSSVPPSHDLSHDPQPYTPPHHPESAPDPDTLADLAEMLDQPEDEDDEDEAVRAARALFQDRREVRHPAGGDAVPNPRGYGHSRRGVGAPVGGHRHRGADLPHRTGGLGGHDQIDEDGHTRTVGLTKRLAAALASGQAYLEAEALTGTAPVSEDVVHGGGAAPPCPRYRPAVLGPAAPRGTPEVPPVRFPAHLRHAAAQARRTDHLRGEPAGAHEAAHHPALLLAPLPDGDKTPAGGHQNQGWW